MAPRVEVPLDFGLELLDAPSHGNLTLELAPGLDPVMVNTAIMSFNSPVIYRHTTELHQNTVDVVEFSREAVLCFSRACYSGQLGELGMDLLRHLYKISVVFKVDWMEKRCVQFYKENVGCTVKKGYNYEDFLVFYKEAEYASIHLKKDELLTFVIAELSNHVQDKRRFINDYIADIDVLSSLEVGVVCKFAEDSKELLVQSVLRCLEKDHSSMSPNCNIILENADLVSCFKSDRGLLVQLQHSIDSVDIITKRDMATNMKMLKQVYDNMPPQNMFYNVTPRNLFHRFQEIIDLSDIDALISYITYDSKDPNFFTLIDGLYSWTSNINAKKTPNYKSFVETIWKIKREFGWDPLPYEYFKNLSPFDDPAHWFDNLQLSDLFIETFTTKTDYLSFYSKNLTSDVLFSSTGENSFILKPKVNITNCSEEGNCGILVKILSSSTTGESGDAKRRFDVQVCFVPERIDSESEVHFHNELVSPNIHLCLYRVQYKDFLPITWYGKPERDSDKLAWRWGANYFCNQKDENTFMDSKTIFKWVVWSGRGGEVQLAAFVKIS